MTMTMKVQEVLKLIPHHECYVFVRLSDDNSMLIRQTKTELKFQLKMLDADAEINAFVNNSNQLIVGW